MASPVCIPGGRIFIESLKTQLNVGLEPIILRDSGSSEALANSGPGASTGQDTVDLTLSPETRYCHEYAEEEQAH